MILELVDGIDATALRELIEFYDALHFESHGRRVVVTASSVKAVEPRFASMVRAAFPMKSDIQLASREYRAQTREFLLGRVPLGGATGNTVMIAGPCSVESEEQIRSTAQFVSKLGVKILRAGCFKPRTSPYTFQGLGLRGLELLRASAQEFDLQIITEVRDSTHVDAVIEYADIIQIGAKAMYDHGILRSCGQSGKPVLLKRGFGATLQEFVQCAEFVLSGGNERVMLCERGIRTFETKTRFTLDLCGVAFLKQHTNLPVFVDPSHAMGYRYGVSDLTRAAMAMGIDGLLIEVHPTPNTARSDAEQQLDFAEFEALYASLPPVAAAVHRQLL